MTAEIEVLVRVEKGKDTLLSHLFKNSSFKEERLINDIYFFDPLRNDLRPDENGRLFQAMRLRNKEGIVTLTHKVDHFDDKGKWTYSDEAETIVDSHSEALQILTNLGLKQLIRINVKKLFFQDNDFEISVEDVERLGAFLEVEFKGIVNDNHKEIKSQIEAYISDLPCETTRKFDGGKPELMIAKYGVGQIA